MTAFVKTVILSVLTTVAMAAASEAGAATLTLNNATGKRACVVAANWETSLLCLPPTDGSSLPCTYQPLPQWHETGWQCLNPGETRGFAFDSTALIAVQVGGSGDYVATHPLPAFGGSERVWIRQGLFETRIAPLDGGTYAAAVSINGEPWQNFTAFSAGELGTELQQRGFSSLSSWRLDRSFNIRLTLP